MVASLMMLEITSPVNILGYSAGELALHTLLECNGNGITCIIDKCHQSPISTINENLMKHLGNCSILSLSWEESLALGF